MTSSVGGERLLPVEGHVAFEAIERVPSHRKDVMLAISPFEEVISPRDEIIAYETLWAVSGQSEKSLSELFQSAGVMLPTQLLQSGVVTYSLDDIRAKVEQTLSTIDGFSVCLRGMPQYPERLRDARYPVEMFYYKGDLTITERRCVSIVGAREASPDGIKRAKRLSRELVQRGFAIVSGLAKGIDTAAMVEAVRQGGQVIGVIGTPITEYYPKENRPLQDFIGKWHLLVSQVPFHRYQEEPFSAHKHRFPQRNVTMAALSEATIIVEASDTSGTLSQARACLQQKRKLFILDSCFQRPGLTWPSTYEQQGAIRVRTLDDVLSNLAPVAVDEQLDQG